MADEVLEPQGDDTATAETTDYKAMYEELSEKYSTLQANSRKWEKRAKESNTDNAALNKNYESEKERADRLEAELSTIRANSARKKIIADAASEYGVSPEVLGRMSGDDVDTIRTNAEYLKETLGNSYASHKDVKDGGEPKNNNPLTVADIKAIKNRHERLKAIKENKHLFEKES